MSKKHDKFKQVRLDPETVKRLEELQAKAPAKLSLASLANALLLQADLSKLFPSQSS